MEKKRIYFYGHEGDQCLSAPHDTCSRIRQPYKEFIEMMGIAHLPLDEKRQATPIKITGTIHKNVYRIEKLYLEYLHGLFVRANL